MTPQWLAWARKLQSIAQMGLHYAENPYDAERYEAVRRIAAEMMADHADVGADDMARILASEAGPGTPKVDVRGAVIRDDRILLVREAVDGRWAMPGGWADVNESPARNVAREVQEETGFAVRVDRLIQIRDKALGGTTHCPYHAYTLYFLCSVVSGQARGSLETTEVAFFAEGGLPPLSETRTTAGDVARAFAACRDPHLPVYFD
jgi:ADP-ribose pyrophosphatase YjhB (NUDIX family)